MSLPCVREKMVRISSKLFQELRLSRNPDRKWEAPLQGRVGTSAQFLPYLVPFPAFTQVLHGLRALLTGR